MIDPVDLLNIENRKEKCRLCDIEGFYFATQNNIHYFQCPSCQAVFMAKEFLPSNRKEIIRYSEHNNNVDDPKYRQFVSPVTDSIQKHFNRNHHGLDFGSGTGPVITAVLREKDFQIETYDPFFDPRPELLRTTYDYIACCEVVEHFHNPKAEFELLKSLLKPNGKLFILTDLISAETNFAKWYYKNDLTHVFFFHQTTFKLLKNLNRFSSLEINGRLTTYTR